MVAIGLVIRARPQLSPNLGCLEQLKRLELGLLGSNSLVVDALPMRGKDRLALFEDVL